MAAEMISILPEVSAAISAENCIGWISILNPPSLAIPSMTSTITPWMVLVLASRKVKGVPVGVDPTL
ncbi:hypothetical protein D3C87_1838860 [compost metagenome]